MSTLRTSLALLGVVAVSGSAFALDFGTTAFIDGTAYTIGAAGSPVQRLGNTLSFSLPNGVALSGVSKSITLTYGVFATPGLTIATATEFGTGQTTTSGTASIVTRWQSGAASENSSQFTSGSTTLTPYTHNFALARSGWTPVTTTIDLVGNNGLAKVSAFSANYTEVVPEPFSLGALAIGSLGLIVRRRRSAR